MTDVSDLSRRRHLWLLARAAGQLVLAVALAIAALLALGTGTPLAALLLAIAAGLAAVSCRRTTRTITTAALEEALATQQLFDVLRQEGWTVRHRISWDQLSAELDHVAIPPHGLAAFVVDSTSGGRHPTALEQLVDGAAWVAARGGCRQGALPVVVVDGVAINELGHIDRDGTPVPVLTVSLDETLAALRECAEAAAAQSLAAEAR